MKYVVSAMSIVNDLHYADGKEAKKREGCRKIGQHYLRPLVRLFLFANYKHFPSFSEIFPAQALATAVAVSHIFPLQGHVATRTHRIAISTGILANVRYRHGGTKGNLWDRDLLTLRLF